MRYTQATDGDTIRPKMRGYRTRCCDCGLVHVFDFRVVKAGRRNVVQFTVRADRKAAAANRRRRLAGSKPLLYRAATALKDAERKGARRLTVAANDFARLVEMASAFAMLRSRPSVDPERDTP